MASLLREHLERVNPAVVDEAERERIKEVLGPVSDRLLRDLLRESGYPLSPLVEGVRQADFDTLERTLLALAQAYREAKERGDVAYQKQCRQAAIAAKDHARLVERNPSTAEEKRAQKTEMVLWLITWLENPDVFESWVALRRQVLSPAQRPQQNV